MGLIPLNSRPRQWLSQHAVSWAEIALAGISSNFIRWKIVARAARRWQISTREAASKGRALIAGIRYI